MLRVNAILLIFPLPNSGTSAQAKFDNEWAILQAAAGRLQPACMPDRAAQIGEESFAPWNVKCPTCA